MPHLHIKKFKEIPPCECDEDLSFGFVANNIDSRGEKLIATLCGRESFFLLLKEQGGKSLLKVDKTTRPPATHTLQKALLGYAKEADLEVLSSNVVEKMRSLHLKNLSYLKDIEFFANQYEPKSEIWVEIGFGSGRHLLHQAKANPHITFIALEIHKPSIEQVLKQINIQNIENIYLLDYDARLFLELLESNVVGRIFVHFPVPWDKKPHRRVISKAFVQEAKRVLKVGGTLELRTDSDLYYEYSYETMLFLARVDLSISKNRDIAVSSKYEDRWKRMHKNIYDLTLINDEHSPLRDDLGELAKLEVLLSRDDLLLLHKKRFIFEGGFLNFERLYELDGGLLFRLSLGDFARAQNLYLLVKDAKASYFAGTLLKTRAAVMAHNKLKELLHG
ncbi:MAG: tRNA (guanosine(46)-N7)-methyltransferase TrmB [Sulfuricurvum sp.]